MTLKRMLAVTLLLAVAGPAMAEDEPNAAQLAAERIFYPLKKCPISGNPLGGSWTCSMHPKVKQPKSGSCPICKMNLVSLMGKPIDLVKQGRLIRICCKMCTKGVDKNVDKILASIDQAYIAAQTKGYPLSVCPVDGMKLGAMKPVRILHGIRLVQLCGAMDLPRFKKDPARYMKQIDAALIAAQRKTYTLKICPVSGNPLGKMGVPFDLLYHTQLVRFCCKMCVKGFNADPAKHLKKLLPVQQKKLGMTDVPEQPAKQGQMLAVLHVEGMH